MEESVLKIIIFGGIILFSIIKSISSGKKKGERSGNFAQPMPPHFNDQAMVHHARQNPNYSHRRPQSPRQYPQMQQPNWQQPQQPQPAPFLVTNEGQRVTGPQAAQQPTSKYTPLVVEKTKAANAPAPFLNTNEGERVTQNAPMASASTRPRRQPLIQNKDDLRRAIILGEALAPKF